MKMKLFKLAMTGIFFMLCTEGYAQADRDEDNLYLGFIGGANYSKINQVDNIIISESYFSNFTKKNQPRFGGLAGFSINYYTHDYIADEYIVSIYGEAAYSWQGTRFAFDNTEKDFYYTMDLKYQYANFMIQPRVNIENFYLGAGLVWGYSVTPNNIVYKSGGKGDNTLAFGSDREQEQQLETVLHGTNNIAIVGSAGFRISDHLNFEGRVLFGVKNVVQVDANSYNFVHQYSNNIAVQALIGYSFYNKRNY